MGSDTRKNETKRANRALGRALKLFRMCRRTTKERKGKYQVSWLDFRHLLGLTGSSPIYTALKFKFYLHMGQLDSRRWWLSIVSTITYVTPIPWKQSKINFPRCTVRLCNTYTRKTLSCTCVSILRHHILQLSVICRKRYQKGRQDFIGSSSPVKIRPATSKVQKHKTTY